MSRKNLIAILIYIIAFALVLLLCGEADLWLILIYAATILTLIIEYLVIFYRFRKDIKPLHMQCDPDAYLQRMGRRLDKALRWSLSEKEIALLRLNIGAGLNAAGRYSESLAAMGFVNVFRFKKGRENRVFRFVYHHNHFADFIEMKMMTQAQDALLWLNDCANAEKPGKTQNMMGRRYRQDYHLFEMECGRYDGAEEVFTDMFGNAKNTYERVMAMMTLAQIHEHFGRSDQARAAYEYVAEHGNHLYVAALARKKLASANGE